MKNRRALRLKALPHFAAVRPVVGMSRDMNAQMITYWKPFSTNVAHMILLFHANAQRMSSEIFASSKSFTTMLARVRPLTRMRQHVLFQTFFSFLNSFWQTEQTCLSISTVSTLWISMCFCRQTYLPPHTGHCGRVPMWLRSCIFRKCP